MGGEKDYWGGVAAGVRGSPPHGRGKGVDTPRALDAGRITPAWAGKSHFLEQKILPL